jgi:hypothetical protein
MSTLELITSRSPIETVKNMGIDFDRILFTPPAVKTSQLKNPSHGSSSDSCLPVLVQI